MNSLILLGTVHRDPAGKKRLLNLLDEIKPSVISLEVSPASIELRKKWGRGWNKIFNENLDSVGRSLGRSPRDLLKSSAIRGVFEYIRLPFEYRGALDYAMANSLPLFLLDDSQLAASYLCRVEKEILSEDNMTLLAREKTDGSLAEEVNALYKRADRLVFPRDSEPVSNESFIRDPAAWTEREAALSQKIRLLHQSLIRWADKPSKGRDLASGLMISSDAVGFMPDEVKLNQNLVHIYVGGWEHLVEDTGGNSLFSKLRELNPARRLCIN